MRTDSKRLQQVLRNLLSNALKFTEKGGVTLKIGTAEGSPLRAGTEWLAFSVIDTGIGVGPSDLARLFEGFFQADQTLTRRYAGSGIGLAICKKIVERHGGRIWLESRPGEGTTFFFALPALD